jgi:hypothetical protein
MTLREFISKVQEREQVLINTITSMEKFTKITNKYNIDLSLFRGDMALGEVARLMIIEENK